MKQGGQAARPSQASGRNAENGPLNRGSPAPPPAERSGCSLAPAPSCGSRVPLGTAGGAQEAAEPHLPRRCPGVLVQGFQMPGVRLGAFPVRLRRDLNLGLEGELFDLVEGHRAAAKPRGQGPSKGQGLEGLNPDRLGETGKRGQIPEDKTRGPVGFADAARRCPEEHKAVARTNFPAAEGRGRRAAEFPPLPASALLHLPACNPPPSLLPPWFLPSPACLCSLRLFISLLSPPPSPSCVSPPLFSSFFSCAFFCMLPFFAASVASFLLRAAGRR